MLDDPDLELLVSEIERPVTRAMKEGQFRCGLSDNQDVIWAYAFCVGA